MINRIGALICIVFLQFTGHNAQTADYCNASLCISYDIYGNPKPEVPQHIACGNSGLFGPNCSADAVIIPIESTPLETQILQLHNNIRNDVALGNILPFKPAAAMMEIQWNSELAYLASLHVKLCEFRHDDCRNTPDFPMSGQNLGYVSNTDAYDVPNEAVNKIIENWVEEHNDAFMENIDSFANRDDGKPIGHFTAMVQDRLKFVGCAMAQYQVDKWKRTMLTCNYSFNNIFGSYVYQSGDVCSLCPYGKSITYPGLCNPFETVAAVIA